MGILNIDIINWSKNNFDANNIMKFILFILIVFFLVSSVISVLQTTEQMISVSKINNPTWHSSCNNPYKIYTKSLDKAEYTYNHKCDLYIPCSYNNITEEMNKISNITSNSRIFIIDNADQISSKYFLWKNLVDKYGRDQAEKFAPATYLLNNNIDIALLKARYSSNKLYIMKRNIQQQKGLHITNDLNDILKGWNDEYVVVQELLQNPYLIDGHKINLRFYILILCNNGEIEGYIYPDGFVYYTPDKFKLNSTEDKHNITTGYIDRKIYERLPLTHEDLRTYLGKGNANIMFANIYNMLAKVIDAIKPKVCRNNRFNQSITFQIFGADVAPNDKLEAQIIEINKGPDLGAKDERDGNIKRGVVDSTFVLLGLIDGTTSWIKI